MTGIVIRRPTEADHGRVLDVAEEWWGTRRVRGLVRRMWFRHFAARSWIADTPDGRLVAFLLGFVSADDPALAVIHLAGVDPNRRRQGLGRELVRRFCGDVAAAGAHRVEAAVWPEDRRALSFLRAVGFVPDEGPGTTRLYGTPAYPDWEGPGEDVAILTLQLD